MAASSTPFRAFPFLDNPHVQTVVANLLDWTRDHLPADVHLIPVSDGDAVALHETTPAAWTPGRCCVMLVHGLGGSHRSAYLRRMTNELAANGLRVYRMDLRGCGAGMAHARRFYNAACSDDVRACLDWIGRQNPGSPLLLAGFSLGGNIVLKLAGEAARNPVAGLLGVAAVAGPIDLLRCSKLIANFPVYDRFYVRTLVDQVRTHERLFPELPPIVFPRRMTLWQFDELYTAPKGGYAGVHDYYERASALPYVPRIELPAYLLSSRDDPFVAWQPYAELPPKANLQVELARGGGHLGFLGSDGRGGIRWAETRVVDWLLRQASQAG